MTVSHKESARRLIEVDIIRGLGIVTVILIHSLVPYLNSRSAYFLWDTSQFAVQFFVFCSAYIFFVKEHALSFKGYFHYLKKRFIRLLSPYYIFLVVFLLVSIFFKSHDITVPFVLQSIFVIGGVDINWLVLLFLQFAAIFPLIEVWSKSNKYIFWLTGILTVAASLYFLFEPFSANFKFIMWLSWSTIIFFAYFIHKIKKDTVALIYTSLFIFLIFFLTQQLQIHLHHSLKMFDNKYPPNIYFLSYGLMYIPFIFWLLERFPKLRISFPFRFFSEHSFPLFFIHYTVIYILEKTTSYLKFPWLFFFLSVLSISIVIELLISSGWKKLQEERLIRA